MHFKIWTSLILAIGVSAAIASSSPAIPSSGVSTLLPLYPTNIATTNITSTNLTAAEAKAKEQQAQKILGACPEAFDAPIFQCSLCGGESPTRPGYCKDPNPGNRICQCTSQVASTLTTSIVTTTANGQTGTGTYELDTVTEFSYQSLRQSITISTTATQTITGDPGVETVAVVVLAGGVAWFLADTSGGAAAIAELQPPESAENHDDDQNCPTPENRCSDCGGSNQMCTKGSDSGCACKEDLCPAEGSPDQPLCTDDDCDGEKGVDDENIKCTTGMYKGCDCRLPPCPDRFKIHFPCSDCGGVGADGKCKGDPDYYNVWAGCDCTDMDWRIIPPPLIRKNAKAHAQARALLPDLPSTPSSTPTSTAIPTPKCNASDSSVIPRSVFAPLVYTEYCNAINFYHSLGASDFVQIVDANGCDTSGPGQILSKRGNSANFSTNPTALDFNATNIEPIKLNATYPNRTDFAVHANTAGSGSTNPFAYTDWNFVLEWTAYDDSCSYADCAYMYDALAESDCGHTGPLKTTMAMSGEVDTGCGLFIYNITTAPPSATSAAPTPTPTTKAQVCEDCAAHLDGDPSCGIGPCMYQSCLNYPNCNICGVDCTSYLVQS